MYRQTRLILCINCPHWFVAPNIEQGTCEIKQDDETIKNTTNYDTRCIYGFAE